MLKIVCLQGTIGVFETLGSEYATDVVALSSSSTGYVFSALGACGALTLVCFSRLVQHHDEVRLTISGIYLMILSCVMMSLIPLTVTMDTLEEHAIFSPLIACWFLLAVSAMYATGTIDSFHLLLLLLLVLLILFACCLPSYSAVNGVTDGVMSCVLMLRLPCRTHGAAVSVLQDPEERASGQVAGLVRLLRLPGPGRVSAHCR